MQAIIEKVAKIIADSLFGGVELITKNINEYFETIKDKLAPEFEAFEQLAKQEVIKTPYPGENPNHPFLPHHPDESGNAGIPAQRVGIQPPAGGRRGAEIQGRPDP